MADFIYDSWDIRCKEPFGAAATDTKIRFSLRSNRGDALLGAVLKLEPDDGEPFDIALEWSGVKGDRDVYTCEYMPQEPGLYWYWFEVETPYGKRFINRDEKSRGGLSYSQGDKFQLTVYDAAFKTPDWLKGGVMYQIMPDRFFKAGDFPREVQQGRNLRQKWGDMPPQGDKDEYCANCFFGGNLKGVKEKLPYLKSLGVTAIYFNPIFDAYAYHHYDTADYMKIDPMLGTEEDFKALCAAAREAGISIILDGVFSHTGADSVYFNINNRFPEAGAYNSQDSKYYEWYDFEQWPNKYRCWWNFIDLPEVNETNPAYLEFITGEGGVLKHWLDCGARGWRLDVADELPDEFIERLRGAVKEKKNDAVVIGEVWEDASNKISYSHRRRYFEGAQLDSVMNYPWRGVIVEYVKNGNAERLADALLGIYENYPRPAADVLMNIMGSHDTTRLITGLAGASSAGRDRSWKQAQKLSPNQRERGRRLVMLASTIQYFLPGVPCVYYGDEAGMEGYEDPFNRQCFAWGQEDTGLLDYFRLLGRIRGACSSLASGGFRVICSNRGLFAFVREDDKTGDTLVCVVNSGCEERVLNVSGRLCVQCGGASLDGKKLILPPDSCAVTGIGAWAEKL